jgi:hypothetical protein
MTLLIMNRRPIVEYIPFWLSDLGLPLVLITARSAVTPQILTRVAQHYQEIIVVDNYNDTSVQALMLETARRVSATRILSITEADVIRAAWVREQLSLPGQNITSAMAFRNKFYMKTLAANAGVATTPMQMISSPADLKDFCSQHGFPIVVKPVDGGGSAGVRVLDNEEELTDFLREAIPTFDTNQSTLQWMVESWVDGHFFTIDGLMTGGNVLQIWPSRTTANLLAVKGPSPLLSGMLLLHDPLLARIRTLVSKVIATLPPMNEITTFHAEVFHTPDDKLIFCEIACRPGGCGHVPVYEKALGVNLYAASLRGQAGCNTPPLDLTANPRCMAGFAWFPPRAGILKQIPTYCPVRGVSQYENKVVAGTVHTGARSVADHIGRLFISCPADEDIQPKLEAVDAWWSKECIWTFT